MFRLLKICRFLKGLGWLSIRVVVVVMWLCWVVSIEKFWVVEMMVWLLMRWVVVGLLMDSVMYWLFSVMFCWLVKLLMMVGR